MIKYFEPRILLTQCDQAPNPYGLDPPLLLDLQWKNYKRGLMFFTFVFNFKYFVMQFVVFINVYILR